MERIARGTPLKALAAATLAALALALCAALPQQAWAAQTTSVSTAEDLRSALNTASDGDTVEFAGNIAVEGEWAACPVNEGVTIDGKGYSFSIGDVGHYWSHSAFYGTGFTVQNLTITMSEAGDGNGISVSGGKVSNVSLSGFSSGITVSAGTVVEDCKFSNGNWGIYAESDKQASSIKNCVFDTSRAVALYGSEEFTNNQVNGDKGLSVATAGATIEGNTFTGERAMSISAGEGVKISGNSIGANSKVEFAVSANLSGNYWGSATGPSEGQLVQESSDSDITVETYYTAGGNDGDGNLSLGELSYKNVPAGPDMSGSVVNVTADQAQYLLDGAYGSIDGKTINFTEDVTDVLVLARPTKYQGSNTVYYNYVNYALETTATPWSADISSVINSHSNYYRTVKNVTFTAAEGVEVAGFSYSSGHNHSGGYDYVRDVATGNGVTCYEHGSLENIAFEGLTVTGQFSALLYSQDASVENVSFDGCVFTGETDDGGDAAIKFLADNKYFPNVVVKDCSISDYFQGVFIQGVDGADISNNEIENTEHNAIALQSHDLPVKGEVTVAENYIEDAGDRAIRLNAVGEATIAINNNIMVDSGDDAGELIKSGEIAPAATIDLENNYWDGKETSTAIAGELAEPEATGVVAGTFKRDVSAYLADGFKLGEDGKVVPITYTVTFNAGDGSAVPSQTVEIGKAAVKPADPTKDGYTFDGWFLGNEEYDFSKPVTSDITLVAKFVKNAPVTHTVTYLVDGNVASSETVEDGKAVTGLEVTREGYTFDGWFTDKELTKAYDMSKPVTADIALYAKFTAVQGGADEPGTGTEPDAGSDGKDDAESGSGEKAEKPEGSLENTGDAAPAAVAFAAFACAAAAAVTLRRFAA